MEINVGFLALSVIKIGVVLAWIYFSACCSASYALSISFSP